MKRIKIYKEHCSPPLSAEKKAVFFKNVETFVSKLKEKAEKQKEQTIPPNNEKIHNLERIYDSLCHTADLFGGFVKMEINSEKAVSYVSYDGGVFVHSFIKEQDLTLSAALCLSDSFFLYSLENGLFRMIFLADVFQGQ